MAEKSAKAAGPGTKPVPMKFFAAWELEKTAPSCIPRLCTLSLNRLTIHKPLENDLTSVIIAVKMQNTKRILRSNEIVVPSGGLLDTELDLTFSLQYPHYLKRDGKLQVMLQRRKKYKNKTILGYKTMAVGQVNMAHVLQRPQDQDLWLYSDQKDSSEKLATLVMLQLSSQPVDHVVENGQRKANLSDLDRSPDVDNESYDEEDETSNDELSDAEGVMMDDEGRPRVRKSNRGQNRRPVLARGRQQRNIKQKFIALLKKFKVTDEVLDVDHELEYPDTNPDQGVLDDLIDELESMSDSGPENDTDTVSVISTPKPRLRPFFQKSGSGADMDAAKDSDKLSDDSTSTKKDSDSQMEREKDDNLLVRQSPEIKEKISRGRSRSYKEGKSKKDEKTSRRHSTGPVHGSPRKVLLDQLGVVLGGAEDKLPENLILVNTAEWQGQLIVQMLQDNHFSVICTCGEPDVKAAISALVSKIQKYCNSNSKAPSAVKVCIAGSDSYINTVMRPYVEQFSAKPPDWQTYVQFLVIPFGSSSIGKYIATLDTSYSLLFLDQQWKDTFDKTEVQKLDSQEIVNRVSKYLNGAASIIHIPIAEAMVMCREKSGDEESSQILIPFISEVKIGSCDTMNASVDFEEGTSGSSMVNSPSLSSSPPSNITYLDKPKVDVSTPPSSPNVNSTNVNLANISGTPATPGEFMELQVDYWTSGKSDNSDKTGKKDGNKCTLKTTFKSLQVQRLGQNPLDINAFSMVVVTREKKQKIMRIGKKAKEGESKSQIVEGINRLICTTKSQSYVLKVMVDGVEWSGVKFFQLSSQWQTHIKHFPIAVLSNLEPL